MASEDPALLRLMAGLADVIRDVPAGKEHTALFQRFVAVVKHLEGPKLLKPTYPGWNLSSRR